MPVWINIWHFAKDDSFHSMIILIWCQLLSAVISTTSQSHYRKLKLTPKIAKILKAATNSLSWSYCQSLLF